VLLAAVVARAPSLRNGFVNYDDREVRQEAASKGLGEIWGGTFYYAYKPVYGTSAWIDERLFGDQAAGWHAGNVALFALAAALAALVAWRVTRSAFAGAAVGLLVGVHPAHTENVAWVAERKDALSLALVLAAHLAWRRGWARPARVPLLGALLFVLGGLAKGTVWTYAGVVALDDGLQGPREGRARRLTALVALALAGIGLDAWVGATMGPGAVRHDATPEGLVAAMAGVHARYAATLAWPSGLSVDRPVDPAGTFSDPWALAGIALALAAVAGLVVGVRRRRPVHAIACATWLLGLAPVNNVWPTTSVLRADRYLLVPALGAYLLLGQVLERRRPVASVALAVLVAALGVASFERASVFRDSETLWTDAVAAEPASAVGWLSRAQARQERGAWPGVESDAARGIEAAKALRRPELVVRGRSMRSLALLSLGRVDEALDEANATLREAGGIRRSPSFRDPARIVAEAHARVAQALVERGRRAGGGEAAANDLRLALDQYRQATQADPRSLEAWLGLGNVLSATAGRDAARTKEAAEALDRAWSLAPGDVQVAVLLVPSLYNRGLVAEARARFAEAQRLHGDDRELVLLHARVFEEGEQDAEKAAADYQALLARDPRDGQARAGLAAVRRRQGAAALAKFRTGGDAALLEEAVRRADQALEAFPRDAEAETLAGDALFARGRFHDARERYAKARADEPGARWRAVLEARAGTYEALALWRAGSPGPAAAAMAEVVRIAPPRVDLGFAVLDEEVARLAPAAEALAAGKEPEATVGGAALRAAALLASGDDGKAEAEASRAFAGLSGEPARGSRLAAASDAALLVRALARGRRLDLAGARTDLSLLARGGEDALVVHHGLLLDRAEAQARVRIATAEGGAALEAAKARAAEVARRIREAASKDAPWPGPGLLAVEVDMQEGAWLEALKRLATLRRRFPESATVRRGEAAVYEAQALAGGDRQALRRESRRALDEARDLDPRDPRTALDLSQWHRLSGDLENAAIHAAAAASAEPVPGPASRALSAILVDRGRHAVDKHDWEKALQAAASARAADPGSAAPDLVEGDVWTAKQDLQKALAAYRLAREKEPASGAARSALAQCHRRRGSAYFLWKLQHPRPAVREGVAGDADRAKAWDEHDAVARRQAEDDLRAALRLEPEGPDAEAARSQLDALEGLDPDAARSRALAAMKAYEEGEDLRRKGDLASALERYREAARLFPDRVPPWMRIAEVGGGLGEDHEIEALLAIETVRDIDAEGRWPEPDLHAGRIWTRRALRGEPGAEERARRSLGRFLSRAAGLGAAQDANRAAATQMLERLDARR
jgi:tetratricopeptide (TPR) repeat protein